MDESTVTRETYEIDLVGPDDRAALEDLFTRSTVETRYRRFHHMVSAFPHQHLDDLTCSHCPHLALAARRQDGSRPRELVGLASADISGSEAEIAVWIADDWQRQGVGAALITELAQRLVEAGVRTATAVVSLGNSAALGLVRSLAPQATPHRLDGNTVEFRVGLSPDPAERPHPVPTPRPAPNTIAHEHAAHREPATP